MHEQFLQAIIDEPDEDTHRLAYADWLNEQNGGVDPRRAEFIRVQIELAKYGEYRCPKYNGGLPDKLYGVSVVIEDSKRSCGCRWCELVERQFELLGRADWVKSNQVRDPEYAWLPKEFRYLFETGGREGRHDRFWTWQRGFVEHIRLPAKDWLAHADELVQAAPIREVEFVGAWSNLLYTWPQNGRYAVGLRGCTLYIERDSVVGTLTSQLVLEILTARWPRIKFTLPSEPPSQTLRIPGNVLEVPAAEDIAIGEFVVRTPDGRVRRTAHRDGAVGIAVSPSENSFVRVHLLEPFPAD